MNRNTRGRPPNKDRNIIKEILDEFQKNDNPIRFKDLRIKVKMSSATLAKYLNYLCLIGVIDKKRVKSGRGKGMEYCISRDTIPPWNKIIEKQKNFIVKTPNHDTTNLKNNMEYKQAFYIFDNIKLIDLMILQFFKVYTEAEKKDQDKIFETYMFLIKGVINELTQLVSEPIGMTSFTYNIIKMAYMNPDFLHSIDNSIEKFADIMGLEKHLEKSVNIMDIEEQLGKYPQSLNYSFDELKNLFNQEDIVEVILKENIDKEIEINESIDEILKENINDF